ncbi:hypothetical protein Tco_0004448 [Tanacetum coccineum]
MSNRHQELTSPEQTAPALASPEQTATGKDFSNPFIVGSLLKTTWFYKATSQTGDKDDYLSPTHQRFLCSTGTYGPKKTAWEQFSSNIAVAIICLATNRRVKKLESQKTVGRPEDIQEDEKKSQDEIQEGIEQERLVMQQHFVLEEQITRAKSSNCYEMHEICKTIVRRGKERRQLMKYKDCQSQIKRKRKKSIPRKTTRKRQKLEDVEKDELKGFLDIVPREEAPIDIESLSTKFPIVDWKTIVLTETYMYYQVFRGDGSSKIKDPK